MHVRMRFASTEEQYHARISLARNAQGGSFLSIVDQSLLWVSKWKTEDFDQLRATIIGCAQILYSVFSPVLSGPANLDPQ